MLASLMTVTRSWTSKSQSLGTSIAVDAPELMLSVNLPESHEVASQVIFKLVALQLVTQVSLVVHALPSSQEPDLRFVLQVPTPGSQVASRHGSPVAPQTTGAPAAQAPLRQLSFWVHKLPSSQTLPSLLKGWLHTPVAGLHVPGSWQPFCGAQYGALIPVHVPAMQMSCGVHKLPSLHAVPVGLAGKTQLPVTRSQLPALSWHWSPPPTQVLRLLPTQVPDAHVST